MIQPTLINLHPNDYRKGLHYYLFAVNSGRSVSTCNTLNDLSKTLCVPNKTEDLNLTAFKMITGINESKILAKHTSSECKCKFDGRNVIQIKSGITINVGAKVKIKKNIACAKNDYIWNPATCYCENGKYLTSIINNSVITCVEIMEEAKTVPTNFNEKNGTCKTKNLFLCFTCLFINHYSIIVSI